MRFGLAGRRGMICAPAARSLQSHTEKVNFLWSTGSRRCGLHRAGAGRPGARAARRKGDVRAPGRGARAALRDHPRPERPLRVGLNEEDRLSLARLHERISEEPALEASVLVNTPENARLTFDHVVNDRLQDMIESNFKLYEQIADDPEFGKRLLDRLFEIYLETKRVES